MGLTYTFAPSRRFFLGPQTYHEDLQINIIYTLFSYMNAWLWFHSSYFLFGIFEVIFAIYHPLTSSKLCNILVTALPLLQHSFAKTVYFLGYPIV